MDFGGVLCESYKPQEEQLNSANATSPSLSFSLALSLSVRVVLVGSRPGPESRMRRQTDAAKDEAQEQIRRRK